MNLSLVPHDRCTCSIPVDATYDDLRPLKSGCTSRWVCPTLDRARREALRRDEAKARLEKLRGKKAA